MFSCFIVIFYILYKGWYYKPPPMGGRCDKPPFISLSHLSIFAWGNFKTPCFIHTETRCCSLLSITLWLLLSMTISFANKSWTSFNTHFVRSINYLSHCRLFLRSVHRWTNSVTYIELYIYKSDSQYALCEIHWYIDYRIWLLTIPILTNGRIWNE